LTCDRSAPVDWNPNSNINCCHPHTGDPDFGRSVAH
jgi:hypothetical protein